jgi:hypothetical protein
MAKKTKSRKTVAKKKPARKVARKAVKAKARKAAAPKGKKAAKPAARRKRPAAPRAVAAKNEGEGNRSADRAYRDAATRFSVTHDTAAIAEQAAREVEASPHEYDDAENEGLSRSAGDLPQDEN